MQLENGRWKFSLSTDYTHIRLFLVGVEIWIGCIGPAYNNNTRNEKRTGIHLYFYPFPLRKCIYSWYRLSDKDVGEFDFERHKRGLKQIEKNMKETANNG